MADRCADAQALLAYSFSDEGLLQEVLTVAGNCRLVPGLRADYEGNAALAFIGDAYIQLRVGISGCRSTNELLQSKAANSIPAKKYETSGLANSILEAPGVRVVADSTKATALEAVIGAVFLDGGMDAVQNVVEKFGVL